MNFGLLGVAGAMVYIGTPFVREEACAQLPGRECETPKLTAFSSATTAYSADLIYAENTLAGDDFHYLVDRRAFAKLAADVSAGSICSPHQVTSRST